MPSPIETLPRFIQLACSTTTLQPQTALFPQTSQQILKILSLYINIHKIIKIRPRSLSLSIYNNLGLWGGNNWWRKKRNVQLQSSRRVEFRRQWPAPRHRGRNRSGGLSGTRPRTGIFSPRSLMHSSLWSQGENQLGLPNYLSFDLSHPQLPFFI